MIETPAEQLPQTTPLQRFQQLEVDTFCTNCGYNLHAQPVTRDAQLGIFICRCPECGQHHPAGAGVTAASTWGARLATALLVFWVLIILNAVFWISVAFGALIIAHIETLTTTKMIAADGREIEYTEMPPLPGTPNTRWVPVYKGTTQPAEEFGRIRTVDTAPSSNPLWQNRFLAMNLIAAAAIGLTAGVLLVVFIWHWRRRRYLLVLILPFLVGAIAVGLMVTFDWDQSYRYLYGWMISRAMAYAALVCACMLVGFRIGRPLARVLLLMFVPPKARQHFSFMWRIDGKTPPAATLAHG